MTQRDLTGPVRFSQLKKMALSPAHYRAQFEIEDDDSPQKKLGRLVHALVLGGNYVVYDGERRGGAWNTFREAHAGEEIVTVKEYDTASRMANAVLSHEDAAELLRGEHEVELQWSLNDRLCGGRVDVIGPGYVTELKTGASAEPGMFRRSGARMGYHAQLSWYAHGARSCTMDVKTAHIVADESKWPHVVTTFDVTERALEHGTQQWRLWWERLMACEAANVWPAYTQTRVEFDTEEDVELDYDD